MRFFENIYNQLNIYRVETLRSFLLKLRSKIDDILLQPNELDKTEEEVDEMVYQSIEIFEIINGC
jgi:hypothetical protein